MRTFGPFYPPEIQRHVLHAEKLARVLVRIETKRDRWSIGRASELSLFVADVLGDWRVERLATADAGATLEAYLAWLHAGVRKRLRATPSCCRDEVTLDAGV
jgi:hypothetical protein